MLDAILQFGSFLKWITPALSGVLLLPILFLILGRAAGSVAGKLSSGLDVVSSGALVVSRIAAVLIIVSQLLIIIGRYVFGWSASWLHETVIYSFAVIFLLAAPAALKADAHVRVDIFRGNMSGKTKAIVDLVGTYLLLFPVCMLILWTVATSSSFAESWKSLEGSRESDGLPIYYLFRTLIPMFAVLMIVQGLSEAIKNALIIRGLREPPEPHELEHGAA